MFEAAAQLLLTYLLHSSLLLGAVALLDRSGLLARWGLAEPAWRAALLGAWLSSAVALLPMPPLSSIAGWQAPAVAPAAAWVEASPIRQGTPAISQASIDITKATAPSAAPAATPPLDPTRLLLALATPLWLLGAAAGLLTLAWQGWRLRRLVRQLPDWQEPSLAEQASRMAGGLRPELRQSPQPSPWAWGRVIALPAWAATRLSPAQREAVLAHELAHLLRRDPAWRLLTRVAATLGWLQPLNRLALRRLDLLMETACDRWAAERTGGGQSLAESLLHCAEQLRPLAASSTSPRLATAMARPTPALLARMRLLLEPQAMKNPIRFARWWLVGSLMLAVISLPAALPPGSLRGAGDQFLNWVGPVLARLDVGGPNTIRIHGSSGDSEQLLRWQGKARFSENEGEVLDVEGPLLFRERSRNSERSLSVSRNEDGSLKQEYRVNGDVQALDAAGRDWVARMVRMAIDATMSPQERARRVLERQGVEGLLAYGAKAQGDYQRRQRIEALVAVLPEVQRPADWVSRLLALSAQIEGDFEQRHALAHLAQQLPLAEADWEALLQQSLRIGGAFERAELLGALAARLPATPAVMQAWQVAVQGIGSDFERRRALETQLRSSSTPALWVPVLLAAAEGMDSDFEQRQILASLSEVAEPSQWQAIAAASGRISGDFERRQALEALLRRGPSDAATLGTVLDAAAQMSGGHERVQVLLASAPLLPADGSLDARYRQSARGLGNHERGEVERALDR